MVVSGDAVGSTLDMMMPSHTCELDVARTLPIRGPHWKRMVRIAALAQRAHRLRAHGSSFRRRLFREGEASTS